MRQPLDDMPAASPAEARTVIEVVPWNDPISDSLGYDPRSWYVEQFWLGLIGPTGTWLLRRTAGMFDHSPNGFELQLEDTARELGLGPNIGRHSPMGKALGQLERFGLSRTTPRALAVRRRVPPMALRHLQRLPGRLRDLHDEWCGTRRCGGTLTDQRRRSRSIALELFDAGLDRESVELRLIKWHVHPALAHEATRWALDIRRV